MMRQPNRLIILCVASLLALSGCDMLFSKHEKTSTRQSKISTYDAATFTEAVSVARITLAAGGTISDIAPQAKIIEGFTRQKKTGPAAITLAVLEYTVDGKTQRALSPLNDAALGDVMTTLNNSTSYKLKEVKVLGANIAPGVPMKIEKDLPTAREVVEARHQAIITNGYSLPAAHEAKQQMKLLRFFMDSKNRDAAYIAADNTKRLLSSLSQDKDAEGANQLAKELEALEGELRQSMPY